MESLSRLGIGCWQFGDMGSEVVSESVAEEVIGTALAAGVNHFDSAQDYGAGRSESVVGRILANRSEAFVATKMKLAGREDTLAAVQSSRNRLRRDCIDLFYIHWPQQGRDPGPMIIREEAVRTSL